VFSLFFFGQKFFVIEAQYLQAGHSILLLASLLCAFVEYPGNPLTEFPYEIRDFLKTGLLLTYLINTGLAVLALPLAAGKNQPPLLWTAKTFLLGGLAFDEVRAWAVDTHLQPSCSTDRHGLIRIYMSAMVGQGARLLTPRLFLWQLNRAPKLAGKGKGKKKR